MHLCIEHRFTIDVRSSNSFVLIIFNCHIWITLFCFDVQINCQSLFICRSSFEGLSLSHYLLIVQCSYPNSKHTICASGLPLLLCFYNLYAKGKYFGKWPISIRPTSILLVSRVLYKFPLFMLSCLSYWYRICSLQIYIIFRSSGLMESDSRTNCCYNIKEK